AETCGGAVGALRSPGNGFAATGGEPVNLEFELRDGCGTAVDSARVVVSFSNDDAPVILLPAGKGLYRGSWLPVNSAQRVTIEAAAHTAGLEAPAEPVTGAVSLPPD
ncbi:MAG: hypothetical protein NTY38_12790, partial [Acidobacteria bacterium]|nr:hypothetical protein [Acidobacteriota bacterium]